MESEHNLLPYEEARRVRELFLVKFPSMVRSDIINELKKIGLQTTYNLNSVSYSHKLTYEYAFCQFYQARSHLMLVNSNRYLLAKIKYSF